MALTLRSCYLFCIYIDDLEKKEVYNIDFVNSHARKFCMMMVQSTLCASGNLTPTNTRLFLRGKNLHKSEGFRRWPSLRLVLYGLLMR